MAALEDSLSDTKTLRAWAGSTADLLPVLEAMQRQFRDLRGPAIAERTHHEETMRNLKAESLARAEARLERNVRQEVLAGYADDVEEARDDLRQQEEKLVAARESAEHVDDISVQIVTRRGAERRTQGTPAEIVEYLEHKDARELKLAVPAGNIRGHNIYVSFDRDSGVRLSVTSISSRWTLSALGETGEALERKVPAWAWLRSSWFLIPFYAIVATTILLPLLALPSEGVDNVTLYVISALRGLAIGGVAVVAVYATRRFVPAFEILPVGGKARVDRIVIALGASVVAALIRVVTETMF